MNRARLAGRRSRSLRRILAWSGATFAAMLSLTVANANASSTPAPTAQPDSLTVTASPYLVLTASSLEALSLTYAGTFAVSGPSGSVEVLRFTMSAGSLGAMNLTQACTDGVTTVTSAGSASLGSTTFDATSLAATAGGTPLTLTAANPPTIAFPTDILLDDITLTATTMSADTMNTSSFTTRLATC